VKKPFEPSDDFRALPDYFQLLIEALTDDRAGEAKGKEEEKNSKRHYVKMRADLTMDKMSPVTLMISKA
jgi:hypothetical protein